MALLGNELQALTQEYVIPKIQDNLFDKTLTLKYLKEKVRENIDGGEYIKVPILYDDQASAGWYTGWQELSTNVNDVVTHVKYDWAHAYVNMGISKTDELKNAGKSKVVSMLVAQGQSAELTLAKNITTALFSTSKRRGYRRAKHCSCSSRYSAFSPSRCAIGA